MRNRVREREGQIHIQHNYNPPGNVLNTEYQMQGWRGTPQLADQKRRKKSHKEHTLNKNGNGTLHHEDPHTCCSFIRALTCLFARKIPTMCSPLSPHYLRCILYSVLITSFMPCLVCLPRSALQCVFPFPAYRILSLFPLSLVHHTLFAHFFQRSVVHPTFIAFWILCLFHALCCLFPGSSLLCPPFPEPCLISALPRSLTNREIVYFRRISSSRQ